jgi:hypothetical protein
MKNFNVLVIVLILFNCSISEAQTAQDTIYKKEKIDNLYYKSLLDYINVKFDLESNNERFEVDGTDFNYDIRPNVATVSKLSVNYLFLSLSYKYIPKYFPGNNDDDLKGETKGSGFGLNLNFKHWVQDLKYGKVKGFYLENTADFDNSWIEGTSPYIQFPDTEVITFSGSTSYKFNPNLSLKAISTQTEIQLKSAGSFIPGLNYSYYIIDNKSENSSQSSSQKSENIEVLANLSYYYTFVLNKKWYAALGATPSIGFTYTDLLTRYPDEYIHTDFTSGVYRIKGAGGMGYNSERFFAGFEISAYRSTKHDNSTTIQFITSYNSYQAFVGYRFNAPKKIQELAKKAQEKSPF